MLKRWLMAQNNRGKLENVKKTLSFLISSDCKNYQTLKWNLVKLKKAIRKSHHSEFYIEGSPVPTRNES